MNRTATNKINYFMDNWVPPRIRDSRLLMGIAIYMAFGHKFRYFMEFKEKVNDMSEAEINHYYEYLAPSFLNRRTDLNDACIEFILKNVDGKNSILDAAAGRGYLAELLHQRFGGNVTAVDIILPEKRKKGIC